MINDKLKVQIPVFMFAALALAVVAARVTNWTQTPSVITLYAQEPVQATSTSGTEEEPTGSEASPEPVIESQKYDMDDLKRYLKEIFGTDWKTAYAVAQVECNSNRAEWPNCKLSWAKEHSIGWFQINIAQGEGTGKKVHWDKIPGETLEQKEEWLGNPYNNILMAKIIHDRAGGFGPWTGYTNGNYLKYMNK